MWLLFLLHSNTWLVTYLVTSSWHSNLSFVSEVVTATGTSDTLPVWQGDLYLTYCEWQGLPEGTHSMPRKGRARQSALKGLTSLLAHCLLMLPLWLPPHSMYTLLCTDCTPYHIHWLVPWVIQCVFPHLRQAVNSLRTWCFKQLSVLTI